MWHSIRRYSLMIMKSISLLSKCTKMMSECVCTLYICLSDYYNIFFVDLGIAKRFFLSKLVYKLRRSVWLPYFYTKKHILLFIFIMLMIAMGPLEVLVCIMKEKICFLINKNSVNNFFLDFRRHSWKSAKTNNQLFVFFRISYLMQIINYFFILYFYEFKLYIFLEIFILLVGGIWTQFKLR